MRKVCLLFLALLSISYANAQFEQKFQIMLEKQSWFEDINPFQKGALVTGEVDGKAVVLHVDSLGTITWRDSSLNHSLSHGFRLVENSKSQMHLLGNFEASNGVNDIYCRQYSSVKKLQWEAIYDSPTGTFNPDNFSDVAIDLNDNIYVAGNGKSTGSDTKAQLLKYNSSGMLVADTLLTGRWGNGKYVGLEVVSNQVLATFYSQFGGTLSTQLHAFDLDLNPLWEADLPYTVLFHHNSLATNPSGYTAVVGRKFSNLKEALLIFRPNGDTVKHVEMDLKGLSVLYGSKVLMDSSKFIYVLSNYNAVQMLSKYDTTGQLHWADTLSRRLDGIVKNSQVFHLWKDQIICSSFYQDAQLHLFDTSGVKGQKLSIDLPGYVSPKVASITTDSQGGVWVCGAALDSNSLSAKHAFAVYFNKLNPADSTGTGYERGDARSDPIECYPNPASDYLNLAEDCFNVRVYNINGQEVMQMKAVRHLYLKDLPKGLYHLVATDQEGESREVRFVKL